MKTKDKLKTFVIGAVTTVLTSCGFNKKVSQEDAEKTKTEQVIKEMSKQGISVLKKGTENAPDSVLASVDVLESPGQPVQYSNPQYRAETPNDIVDYIKLGKSIDRGFLINEADFNTVQSSTAAKDRIREKIKTGKFSNIKVVKDKPSGRIKKQTFNYNEPPSDSPWFDETAEKNTAILAKNEQKSQLNIKHMKNAKDDRIK